MEVHPFSDESRKLHPASNLQPDEKFIFDTRLADGENIRYRLCYAALVLSWKLSPVVFYH